MTASRKWAARALGLIAIAAALAGCQSTQTQKPAAARKPLQPVAQTPPPPPEPVAPSRLGPLKIALLAPLSGDFADAGRDLVNGAAMALFETPATPAELMTFDTRGDAEAASAALADADQEQADILIGPLFGRNATAIAPELETLGLSALAFSNDGNIAGARVMVMGNAVQAETARIVRHAAVDGARTIAVFGRRDVVGEAANAQAMREAAAAPGLYIRPALYEADTSYTDIAGQVEALLSSDAGASDLQEVQRLKTQLDASVDPQITLAGMGAARPGPEGDLYRELAGAYSRMIAAGSARPQAIAAVVARYRTATGAGAGRVDAVLLTVGGAELSTVAPMFQLYDADTAGVRLLGLSSWQEMDPARARELHGGRFPLEPYSEAFDQRYQAVYGQPPSELAAVAYDAVRVALAAHRPGALRPIRPDALYMAGDVDGARGPVRLSAGGLALRPLEVLEMQPTGLFLAEPARIVDPAGAPPSEAQPAGAAAPGQEPLVISGATGS